MPTMLSNAGQILANIRSIADSFDTDKSTPDIYRGLYNYLYGRVQSYHGHDMDRVAADARLAGMSMLKYMQVYHREIISDVVLESQRMKSEDINLVQVLLLSIPRDGEKFYRAVAEVI